MATTSAEARWRTLLESGVRAPSPHNVQPWRVRVLDDTHAELWIERARTLPNEDVEGSFLVLTMGLFVETLALAAAHQGLALGDQVLRDLAAYSTAALLASDAPMVPFARLTLTPDPDAAPACPLALLAARRTSRLAYHPTPVTDAAAATLATLASAHGHRYLQTRDAAQIERLLALNIEAVFEDLNHRPYGDELAHWLRYTETQSARHRDGLDARCMNQHPAELWTAFHLAWLLRLPPTRPWFQRRYREQIGPVATMGFLGGPFWAPRDAYPTGRFLMRFWLECTRLGYALHPYGNLVTNRPCAARVAAETGFGDVWLAFKIGRSDPPPASRRRTVEEVLL